MVTWLNASADACGDEHLVLDAAGSGMPVRSLRDHALEGREPTLRCDWMSRVSAFYPPASESVLRKRRQDTTEGGDHHGR